jgi:uroporphyrinogen III methyltransferase/synthase
MVYLVGAGPGDVGLITVRGAELLARANVVVYDALSNPDLLRLAPKTAEFIFGGKRAKEHIIPQSEINRLLVNKAKEGKIVVRLKGGDPYVFGRGGEEAEALADARVPFEVVPGVSSFVAVPTYAGIPVTHREHSSKLSIITGHEDPTKEGASIDWRQVAQEPGTKVIMMGTERIGQIAERLIAGGMARETPVAMVSWGTLGRQHSIEGTLATIADVAAKTHFAPPSVAIVGDVVKLRKKLNWFESRPLFGKRIVVTRTREQASELSRRLQELGADVLEIPTIKIVKPTNTENVIDALLELNSYDWLVFTSPNGVTAFFDIFFKRFQDARDLGSARIAAIGPATAAKVQEYHLQVDLMPEEYVSSKIAAAFKKHESIENLKLCLLRAEVANPDLPKSLEGLGAIVDDIAIYKTVPETEDLTGAAAKLLAGGADWLTFMSSSSVEHFHARFDLPKLLKQFPKIKTATIGPETSKALAALGLKPTTEAKPHTLDGLVAALK